MKTRHDQAPTVARFFRGCAAPFVLVTTVSRSRHDDAMSWTYSFTTVRPTLVDPAAERWRPSAADVTGVIED
jgi:hypothetical protein